MERPYFIRFSEVHKGNVIQGPTDGYDGHGLSNKEMQKVCDRLNDAHEHALVAGGAQASKISEALRMAADLLSNEIERDHDRFPEGVMGSFEFIEKHGIGRVTAVKRIKDLALLSRASKSVIVEAITLQGEQSDPAGYITVTARMSDGREVELIRTCANSIYHMVMMNDPAIAQSTLVKT